MDDYWYLGQAYLHTYAWNKIYRSEMFSNIRFPQGMVFEDANTLPLLLKKAHKVVTTNQGRYFYTSNPQGITQTADGEALNMLLKPHVEIIKNSTRNDACFDQYYMHVLNIQMDVYELTGKGPILPKRHIRLQHAEGLQKIKAAILNALGIKTICKLNKLIHYVWRNQ